VFDGATGHRDLTPPPPTSIQDFLSWWPDGWSLRDSFFPPNLCLLKLSLIAGMEILAHDGSYKPKVSGRLGAAAWIMECQSTGATCHGPTSGRSHEVNPYRFELQGIHAGLIAVLALCEYTGVQTGSIHIGCDNLNGIKLSAKCRNLNVSLSAIHTNLIHAI
jgi:hypothetical protein